MGSGNPPAVGVLHARHVTLHMGSVTDTNRWSPDFDVGKESTIVVVWVKFFNLPLHYYNEGALYNLGSLLGKVLRIHDSTLALTN